MELIRPPNSSTIPWMTTNHTTSHNALFNLSLSNTTKPPHNHRQLLIPLRRAPLRQPLAADDAVSGLAIQFLEMSDPILAVKNKAMEISPGLKGTSIFLVGMPSAIKTSLGKLLADVLRYYFFDSDNLVEQAAAGESTSQSFQEKEEGFRESETEVFRQLSSMGRLVVCAGDGAVQNSTNLGFLRHGISIWIDVPLYMVAKGMTEKEIPPNNKETSYEINDDEIIVQYDKMKDGYATADVTISLQRMANQLLSEDLNAITTEDMAIEVLKELEKLTRVKKMMQDAARPF